MLAAPEYQYRVRQTLSAIETLLPLLRGVRAPSADPALQAYATVRLLVDELLEISVADIERAGHATHGTASVSEHIRRLLSAARSLVGLEASDDTSAEYASAVAAVAALRGTHAFDVQT